MKENIGNYLIGVQYYVYVCKSIKQLLCMINSYELCPIIESCLSY